jgi:hypothetical protein
MSQLGAAYIEIKADLARFPASFRRQLKEALREGLAGFKFDDLDAEAERAGREAASDMADGFRQERTRIAEEGEASGRSFLGGFKRAVMGGLGALNVGGIFGGGGGDAGGGGSGIVSALTEGFSQIAQLLEDVLASSVDLLGLLQSGFSSLFAGRGEQLTEFFKGQYERVKELWGRLREAGREVLGRLFDEDSRIWFRNLITQGRNWLNDMGRRGRIFLNDLGTRFRPFFRDALIHGRRFFEDLYARHGRGFFGRLGSAGRGFFGRLGTQVAGFATRMGTQIGSALTRAFAAAGPAIGDAFSKVGSALGSLGGPIGALLPIAGLAAIIPVLVLVAGAATQAAAALLAVPAALGVIGAAIAPVVIALSGFSEAVGAGLSGDTKKFDEALKGLAPSAQKVAKELVALGPQFKSIKANVQQAFFKPLVGAFTVLGRTLIPVLNQGLTRTAGAMGNLAREVINVFSAPKNVKTFQALFASTDRIIQTLTPAVANLAQALLNLIQPALPFLERGAGAFKDFAATVEGFTRRIASDGTLAGWLEKAGHILGTVTGIAKEFGKYLLVLLGGKIGDNGAGFLDDVLAKLKEINAFMQTAEGQEFINNLATAFKAVGKILTFLLGTFTVSMMAINAVVDALRLLARGLEAIGQAAVDGVLWLGDFFSDLWDSITDGLSTAWNAVTRFFGGIGSAIADFFTKTIPGWFDAILGFFRDLPDKAVAAGDGLIEKLKGWAMAGSKAVLDGFLFGLGVAIGIILAFPGQVLRALQALPGALAAFWDTISTGAIDAWNATVDYVVDAVMSVPGLLVAAGQAIWAAMQWIWDGVVASVMAVPGLLADAGHAIWQFFVDLWNGIITDSYNAVVSGVNSVIDWFASIPGRIAALGPRILEAARGIGRNIAKGLTEIGNFATDLGAKVTASLKAGINYVISGINRGIAAVDDKIPGGLPRIPQLAKGAIVDSPTLALIGEAGSEVVIPLTNRARAQDLAEQSGLLRMLRGGGTGTNVTVIAYLDPSGVIIPVVRTVVDDTLDGQGSELPYARAA